MIYKNFQEIVDVSLLPPRLPPPPPRTWRNTKYGAWLKAIPIGKHITMLRSSGQPFISNEKCSQHTYNYCLSFDSMERLLLQLTLFLANEGALNYVCLYLYETIKVQKLRHHWLVFWFEKSVTVIPPEPCTYDIVCL